MTEKEWKIFGELLEILKEKFDDQEKRIKELEWKVELLTEDEDWILVQTKDLRDK
jgi:hypothetical protein